MSDPAVGDWIPCQSNGDWCYEIALEKVLENLQEGCATQQGREAVTGCTYLGIALYKTYQALGTESRLEAFHTFLSYLGKRSDLAWEDALGRPYDTVFDHLASCKFGIGQVSFCANVWQ
jgi:hypothetical protein